VKVFFKTSHAINALLSVGRAGGRLSLPHPVPTPAK
jgi:hypothetical protein